MIWDHCNIFSQYFTFHTSVVRPVIAETRPMTRVRSDKQPGVIRAWTKAEEVFLERFFSQDECRHQTPWPEVFDFVQTGTESPGAAVNLITPAAFSWCDVRQHRPGRVDQMHLSRLTVSHELCFLCVLQTPALCALNQNTGLIICIIYWYYALSLFTVLRGLSAFREMKWEPLRPGLICTETSGPFWIILSICHDAAPLNTLLCGGQWDQCAWLHVCYCDFIWCWLDEPSLCLQLWLTSFIIMQELTATSGSLWGGGTDEGGDWQMMPSRHYLDMTWRFDGVWVISREYITICYWACKSRGEFSEWDGCIYILLLFKTLDFFFCSHSQSGCSISGKMI